MTRSKSIKTKKRGGNKPKFDYTSEEFLSSIESYAKRGFTDKEIALSLGICPQTFSEKKNSIPELAEVLSRGRATVTAAIRAKYFAMAMGGIKIKTETRRFIQEKCHCAGEDKECPDCGGTGWVTLTDKAIIQETISELAPSLQAQSVILYHYDPEWKSVERKQDSEEVTSSGSIDIDKWISDNTND